MTARIFNLNPWTQARVDKMIRLWAAGHSAGQIVTELGQGVTRNAVLGKLYRMGYTQEHQGKKNNPRRKNAPAKRKARVFNPEPGVIKDTANGKARVSFDDIGPGQCRYIPGGIDPKKIKPHEKQYCGLEAVPGLAWCEAHAAGVYNTQKTRERNEIAKTRQEYAKRYAARLKRSSNLALEGA